MSSIAGERRSKNMTQLEIREDRQRQELGNADTAVAEEEEEEEEGSEASAMACGRSNKGAFAFLGSDETEESESEEEEENENMDEDADDSDGRNGDGDDSTSVDELQEQSEYEVSEDLDVGSSRITSSALSNFRDLSGRVTRNSSVIPKSIVDFLRTNFEAPSEVQTKCWAAMLSEDSDISGRDVIAISKTGSGKTLGFLVPLLVELLCDQSDGTEEYCFPRALVLAPTRELAQQSFQVADRIVSDCKLSSIVVGCALGGELFSAQATALATLRPILVVATLGRLLSLCGEIPCSQVLRQQQQQQQVKESLQADAVFRLSKLHTVVLDEADRMLDLGFHDDIAQLSKLIPWGDEVRLVLTSATWGEQTDKAVQELFPPRTSSQRVFISVGKQDTVEKSVSASVTQRAEVLAQQGAPRVRRLIQLLQNEDARVTIVFVVHKLEAKDLGKQLKTAGIACQVLQGDMSQTQRNVALEQFRSNKGVLVATDVAGRGIDVKDVGLVINYSLGTSIENYIHRCGRTGRADKFGTAHTFVVKGKDDKLSPELVEMLQRTNQQVPVDLKIMADKELRKRRQRLQADSSRRAPGNLLLVPNTTASKQLTDEEEARLANRQKQLAANKARKAKANAQSNRKRRGGKR